jgi:hypothetical protein
MKTDDLIRAMVADNASVKAPISRTIWLALGASIILAAAHFFSLLGVRSDFAHAITNDPRFMFKFVFTLGLAIPAALLVLRLARPEGSAGWIKWLLMVPPLLLAGAVALEMQAVPADHWAVSAFGSMPVACMKYIPILSLAPFVAILFALPVCCLAPLELRCTPRSASMTALCSWLFGMSPGSRLYRHLAHSWAAVF